MCSILIYSLAAVPAKPVSALSRQSVRAATHNLRDIFIHVQPDSSVVVRETIRMRPDTSGTATEFVLPFFENAAVSIRNVQIGTPNELDHSIDYLDIPGQSDAPQNAAVYYETVPEPEESKLTLRIINSYAAGEELILRVRYRLEDAIVRYRDVADLRLAFAGLGRTEDSELSMVISFSGGTLPEEELNTQNIYVFTTHNLASTKSFVSIPIENPADALGLPPGALPFEPLHSPNYQLIARDIKDVSESYLRIVFPSSWVSDALIPEGNDQVMVSRILQEEGAEINQQRMQTKTQQNIMELYPYLLVAAVICALTLLYLRTFRPMLKSRLSETTAPDSLKPAQVQYVLDGRIGGRSIQCSMKDLVARGYLDYRERRFIRRLEIDLPDENELALFERHLLHWVWEMMAGREGLSAKEFRKEATRQESRIRFAQQFRRFARLLHEDMIDRNLISDRRVLNLHPATFVIGCIFFLLGIVYIMMSISSGAGGAILMLIGIVFIGWSYRLNHLTKQGKMARVRIQTYRHYLSNYGSEMKKPEKTLGEFEEHFPYAVAVGRETEFIYSLADSVAFEDFVETAFMRRFGPDRLKMIVRKLQARDEELDDDRVKRVYRYVAREIEKDGNAFIASVIHVKLNRYNEK